MDGHTCEEFRRAGLSRRRLLGGVAAAGAMAMTTRVFGDAVRQASFAATGGGNTLVVLSFRGGIDGLGMVVPHGDSAYYAARPTIAVPREQLWAQDAMFGLHPHLQPLKWLWDAGEMGVVNATGLPQPNRSHFSAMEEVEDAAPGSSLRQGWVNRMVGLDSSATPASAVHLGDSTPPLMIEGTAPSVATNSLGDISLSGEDGEWAPRRRQHLNTTWQGVEGALGKAARQALDVSKTLGDLGEVKYRPSVEYPSSWPANDLSNALKDTAQLIKADLGAEVISVDFGSWDMHTDYGTLEWGEMQNMTQAFAKCVSAFLRDLGPMRSKVTVVTISEFGRRVAENGSRGLDHGWGNMMMLMGGGVRGGYHGTWPGLGTDKEVEGDVGVTTDYRQILAEVVHKRFPRKDVSKVFPGVGYDPLGVLTA